MRSATRTMYSIADFFLKKKTEGVSALGHKGRMSGYPDIRYTAYTRCRPGYHSRKAYIKGRLVARGVYPVYTG